MMRKLITIILTLCLLMPLANAWWDNNWDYRMPLNFTGSKNETAVTLKLFLNTTNFNYSNANPNGDDLRFIDADDITEYKYYIYKWNTSGVSTVYVNVSDINTSKRTLYLYYGNAGASSVSSPEGVFQIFDDFNRADNLTLGSAVVGGTWVETERDGGTLNITGNKVVGIGGDGLSSKAVINRSLDDNSAVYEILYQQIDHDWAINYVSHIFKLDGDYMTIYWNRDTDEFQYRSSGITYSFSPNVYGTSNVWYDWAFVSETDKYDIYLDNEKKKDDALPSSSSEIAQIVIGSIVSSDVVYWDDVRVYTGDWEATFEFGSEESVAPPPSAILSNANLTPILPTTTDDLELSCTCIGNGTLMCFGQFYKDSIAYSTPVNDTVTTNVSTVFYTLTSGVTSVGEDWYAEVWCTSTEMAESNHLNTSTRTIQNTAPTLDSYAIAGTEPEDNLKFNAVCTDPDLVGLIGYVQLYKAGTPYGSVHQASMTSGIETTIYTLDNSETNSGEIWGGEFWCGDGTVNTTHQNASVTLSGYLGKYENPDLPKMGVDVIGIALQALMNVFSVIVVVVLIVAIIKGTIRKLRGGNFFPPESRQYEPKKGD